LILLFRGCGAGATGRWKGIRLACLPFSFAVAFLVGFRFVRVQRARRQFDLSDVVM
jgi:hypothetical protein